MSDWWAGATRPLSTSNAQWMLCGCFQRILDNIPSLVPLLRIVRSLLHSNFPKFLLQLVQFCRKNKFTVMWVKLFDKFDARLRPHFVDGSSTAVEFHETSPRRQNSLKRGSRASSTVNARGFKCLNARISELKKPALSVHNRNSFVYLNFSINCTALGDVWCWMALERALAKSQSWLFLRQFIFRQKISFNLSSLSLPPGLDSSFWLHVTWIATRRGWFIA